MYVKIKYQVFLLLSCFFNVATEPLDSCRFVESIPNKLSIKMVKYGTPIKSVTSPFKAAQKTLFGTSKTVTLRTGPMGAWNWITGVEVSEKNDKFKSNNKKEIDFVDSLEFANGLKLGFSSMQVTSVLGNPSEIIEKNTKHTTSQILTSAELKAYSNVELLYLYSMWQDGDIGSMQGKILNCQEGTFAETKTWQIEFKNDKVVKITYSDIYSDVECSQDLKTIGK